MLDSIANSLLIGVIGSLIATLIVFLISQLREHIRHQKRIIAANIFVVDRLRAYIVNADIPTDEILEALRRSAARKYELKEYELWPISTYVEETVAEIVGNIYLKIEDQTSYLEKANKYLQEHEGKTLRLSPREDKINLQWKFIFLFIMFISFLLFYVFIIVFDFIILTLVNQLIYPNLMFDLSFDDYFKFQILVLIISVALVSIIFLITGIIVYPKIKRKIIQILLDR